MSETLRACSLHRAPCIKHEIEKKYYWNKDNKWRQTHHLTRSRGRVRVNNLLICFNIAQCSGNKDSVHVDVKTTAAAHWCRDSSSIPKCSGTRPGGCGVSSFLLQRAVWGDQSLVSRPAGSSPQKMKSSWNLTLCWRCRIMMPCPLWCWVDRPHGVYELTTVSTNDRSPVSEQKISTLLVRWWFLKHEPNISLKMRQSLLISE